MAKFIKSYDKKVRIFTYDGLRRSKHYAMTLMTGMVHIKAGKNRW